MGRLRPERSAGGEDWGADVGGGVVACVCVCVGGGGGVNFYESPFTP